MSAVTGLRGLFGSRQKQDQNSQAGPVTRAKIPSKGQSMQANHMTIAEQQELEDKINELSIAKQKVAAAEKKGDSKMQKLGSSNPKQK